MFYIAGMLCIQKRVYLQMGLIFPAAGCKDNRSHGSLSALLWYGFRLNALKKNQAKVFLNFLLFLFGV